MSATDRVDGVDELYGLPLERFVAQRDTLAKALRKAGDRDEAERVRRLPKPTRAAWAVNAAVRSRPEAARALAESARQLRDAQRELLAGGHPSVLRDAGRRAREAVDELARAAPAGGAATAEKVRDTLHAATLDPEVLAEVSAGRLTRERVASGFLEGELPAGAGARGVGRRGGGAASGGGRARAARSPAGGRSRGSAAAASRGGRGAGAAPAEAARARAAARAEAAGETRRREKLRRAKEEEAAAAHDVGAAERALEQVESALRDRRAQLREAQTRLRDARRRRERVEGR